MTAPPAIAELNRVFELHPVLLDDASLIAECEVTRLRRGGPGGQHRNKVETAVRLCHTPTGVIAEANETRSQERNKKHAIERLRFQLALEVRTDAVVGDLLESTWHEHRRGERMATGASSPSGPKLIAFALNVFDPMDYELKPTVAQLKISSSQLVKFLKSAPKLWAFVNDQRVSRGKKSLR